MYPENKKQSCKRACDFVFFRPRAAQGYMYPARQGTRTPRARVHVPRAPKGKVHVPRASQGARTAPKDKHCSCLWLAPSQDACMLHAQVHARSRGERQVQMTRAAGYMYLAGDGKHEHIYLVRGNTKLNVSLRGI